MTTMLVGDVGRYRTHDGPGIRTVVFFKGCPLECVWCHNPEFIDARPEIAFYPNRCICCGECVPVCPRRALDLDDPQRIDRARCDVCGICAEACPCLALAVVGKEYDLDELVELVLRDRLYYQTSGGGVTLSGGEPTAQMEAAAALLPRLRAASVHTAIETCGFFPWNRFALMMLDNLDLILFDVKFAAGGDHRRHTGRDNGLILDNLAKLVAARPNDVVARIPLIPGYTAEKKNIAAIAVRLKQLGLERYELIPYHPMGKGKSARIGKREKGNLPDRPMSREELVVFENYFKEAWA